MRKALCWWDDRNGVRRIIHLRIEPFEHPVYRWRWMFRCPVCWHFERLLFATAKGPKCRHCLNLRYSPGPD